ncbi:MAG: BatA domain-containing protein [Planctomycetia bacterium]|nr:BatA domain-containing protein [Planctomycetia bacterium]
MSFLAPMLLAGLPLVALPIIIHLINQRRFQTIRWGAMMFLLAANRLSRGYARLRQWLIMAFRMLAIAGLIFAIARPLASGWLGLSAGGRPDTTIVLLDRSPSMQQTGGSGGSTKLETGRQQLVQALKMLGSARWVLVDSTTNKAIEIESPDSLLNSPAGEPASSASDIPAMLQAAHDYIQANKSGRTEIWICSDLRENDWNGESGRWQTLRESFLEFPQGVRFHLLAYPQAALENVAIRVTDVRRQQTSDAAELFISLKLSRAPVLDSNSSNSKISVPVQFEIDGARSELTIEMDGAQFELKDHRIPLERSHERGWGRVSIPADANMADNEFCFVFDRPVPRVAIILADDPQAARPLELAAAISPDPSVHDSAEVISEEQLAAVEWEKLSLLLWQAPLPKGSSANLIQAFVERGGQAVFLPPAAPSEGEFFGVGWKAWVEEAEEIPVENWRGDQELLANTQSGAALPVGQLQIRRYAGLSGESFTPLASVRGGKPLLVRATTAHGGAYFLATTPAPGDSSLATSGVVLYVLVQRALAAGAAVLGNTRQLVAGAPPESDPATWQRVTGDERAISTEFPFHRGVYVSGERLLAVNRPAAEDQAQVLADHRLGELFRGLDFARVDDQAGSLSSLIQEVWRLFLAAMIVALIVEAGLCLPKLARTREATFKTEPVGFHAPGG